MDVLTLVELTYLASAILFVTGLKRMQSPATARQGNALAALAMLVAVVATMVHPDYQILSWSGILIGIVICSLGGDNHDRGQDRSTNHFDLHLSLS